MSQVERWMGPVLRHGVEARIDGDGGEKRVTVFLSDVGEVQWAPLGEAPDASSGLQTFRFWVHAESDAERLTAIQILGKKLQAAGHAWDVIPVRPGSQP